MTTPTRHRLAVAALLAALTLPAAAGAQDAAEPVPDGSPYVTPLGGANRTPPGSPTPDAAATATAGAHKGSCERYVNHLGGTKVDPALANDPAVRALAEKSSDLVTCTAVLLNSDDQCTRLGPADSSEVKDCTFVRYMLAEAKAYPDGRSYMFENYEQCRGSKMQAQCDQLRDALRVKDPAKCPTGELQTICKAFAAMDPKLCGTPRADGKDLASDCKRDMERKAWLAAGVKAAASSAPPRERAFAKAALGEANACAPFFEQAMDACLASTLQPTPAKRGKDVAGTPVPGKPMPAGPRPTEPGSQPAAPPAKANPEPIQG